MSDDGFKLDWSNFEGALARRASTSKRDHLAIAAEQMKGIMRTVLEVTPPGHEGLPGGTRAAMQHGQAKVAADIHALYGGPGDAYDVIKAKGSAKASAFWFLHSKGDEAEAAKVFKAATGDWYGPFDDGKIHGTHFKRGSVRKRKGRPIIYVQDTKALADYVKQQQQHVMFLSAGWKEAFAKLGISLPQFVTKHGSAPSQMVIEISDARIRLVATNAVSYGAATDLQRRIQHAIDRQTGKMSRQWEAYVAQLNHKAGL